MSTRQKAVSRRAAKSASLPKFTQSVCSKCAVVHPAPTGKKCAHVLNRELCPPAFPVSDTTEVSDKTSTPETTASHQVLLKLTFLVLLVAPQ